MEQTGAPKPLVRLELGSRYTLALSPRRLVAAAVMALLLVGCAWVIWQGDALEKNSYGWLVLVANAGMPLIGVGLGLILAPTPRPTDFSGIAAIAVDDVAELNRSTNALISSLNTLISSDELTTMPGTKLRLVSIQEELRRQLYVLLREISRWSQIAPGAEDEIVKGRQSSAAILRKLEREQGIEPDN